MNRRVLPYGRQQIDEDDIKAVVEVLRSDYLTTGPVTDAFETEFATAVGSRYAASCANGTAALHLCSVALGLSSADTVIVPSITFLATANAPRLTGAEICFSDVDPATGLMTAEHMKAAQSRAKRDGKQVRAVFPVHLNGQLVDVESLRKALPDDVAIIEDACHAVGGAHSDGSTVGGCGTSTASIFSFHAVKSMTTGEGGMVTTNSPTFDRAVRLNRNHGMVRDPSDFLDLSAGFASDGKANPWYYEMHSPGFNYRATDIACGLGLAQLRRLKENIAHRAMLMARYREQLQPLEPIVQPVDTVPGCKPGWHLCAVLIDFSAAQVTRASVMRNLRAHGVGSQVHYIPVHKQPYYQGRYGQLDLPGATQYYNRCLSLPLFSAMTTSDVDAVVYALTRCLSQ